ncbi:MAG: transcription termination/antitermination protein NusG [Planctomycetota bacterium]
MTETTSDSAPPPGPPPAVAPTPTAGVLHWYVLRVQSGREEKVKENLEKRIRAKGIEAQIPRVFVPTERVSEMKSGKKKVTERKKYPGYIMIELELNEDTWFLVRETPGIGDFLGAKMPKPMEEHEVSKMLQESTTAEEKPALKIDFKKGDSVRIKEGPFENFEGVVEEIVPAKGLVKVVVTIFGRPTEVELEYWQMEHL